MLAPHRARALLVRQRTQLVNMIRSQLAEFGIVLAKGIQHALKLVERLLDGKALGIPERLPTTEVLPEGRAGGGTEPPATDGVV